METVIRATLIYFIMLVIFRLSGKRTLSELTAFDFILLLFISEALQNALTGNDPSLTAALLVVLTLIGLDVLLSFIKQRFPAIERYVDGLPIILVEDGQCHHERMRRSRVDEDDILAAARIGQGLERLDQIKYAVLERSGGISIVPKPK